MFEGYAGFAEDPMEHLRLERTAGMERHYNFPCRIIAMPECNVTADLMIPVPPCPAKGEDESIPREVPGELAHMATSTVASSVRASTGIGSPCLRQLSK